MFVSEEVDDYSGVYISGAQSPPEKFKELFKDLLYDESKILYTDGSSILSGVHPISDFSVVDHSGKILCKSPSPYFLSSYSVESLAILEALRICDRTNWSKVTIFTDSLFNLSAISNGFDPYKGSFLILEIKDLLVELKKKNCNVKLVWIPAHRGIEGNEHADKTAKQACQMDELAMDESIKVPARELKRVWKKNTLKESFEWAWKDREFRGGRFFELFFDLDNSNLEKSWFDKTKLKRRTISSINRLRSGHSSLKASLFRFLIIDSPECPYCGEDESPEHVFWSCEKYKENRYIMLQSLAKIYGLGPYHLEFLLQIPCDEVAFNPGEISRIH